MRKCTYAFLSTKKGMVRQFNRMVKPNQLQLHDYVLMKVKATGKVEKESSELIGMVHLRLSVSSSLVLMN